MYYIEFTCSVCTGRNLLALACCTHTLAWMHWIHSWRVAGSLVSQKISPKYCWRINGFCEVSFTFNIFATVFSPCVPRKMLSMFHPRPGAVPPFHQPKKGAGSHGAPKEKGLPRRGAGIRNPAMGRRWLWTGRRWSYMYPLVMSK